MPVTFGRVDFHNQRLHALVTKPYGEKKEAARVDRAVAVAQLLIDVLSETGDDDAHIPAALMRVGIDTGRALAVNNGRSGGREPLFLGEPANMAAKFAAGTKTGIYLTNKAREAVDLEEVDNAKATALTKAEIEVCKTRAALETTKDEIVKEWRKDLEKHPIGTFEFSRHTPPLRTLDITTLTPANSRRQEAASVYADIDGFTAYVRKHLDDKPEDVVKAFHVLRAEMDRVLTSEFDGRRIRFIGDCLHGLICEGTAHTTFDEATVSTATLCVGGLRSSFNLSLEKLEAAKIDIDGLGLQIGFEFGPMTITRLGMQGDRVRCSVSRGVRGSEAEQLRCGAAETAIGQKAFDTGTKAVRELFGKARKAKNLDYNEVAEALAEEGDETARSSKAAAYVAVTPALARASVVVTRPHAEGA